ncbi:TonB C-terminal domain-containing protein [bacterium]|nr:TonB C-terminal domain-containing protein [bacterium]
MRILHQSQTYLLASILLHIGLFSVFLANTLSFSPRVDSFEATIMFETPEPPPEKKTVVTTTDAAPKSPKPISVAPPKTELKANLDPENTSALPFSSKNIDDLLKKRTLKPEKKEPSEETIVKKKSDLLGYLKATKRTQDTEIENTHQNESPEKPDKTASPQKNQTQLSESSESTPIVEADETKPEGSKTTETEDVKNLIPAQKDQNQSDSPVVSDNANKKATTLKIWQRKNETQAYRKVLRQLVTANWKVPPVSIKTFQILIEVTIDPNGNLVKTNLIKGSGLAILDAAAERAIRVSTPFPRLPESLESQTKQYQALFRFTPDEVIN